MFFADGVFLPSLCGRRQTKNRKNIREVIVMPMAAQVREQLKNCSSPIRKRLKKLGTLEIGVVETTPVVWKDELWRFEWVRNGIWNSSRKNAPEKGCYHFVNMETGECSPEFAFDHSFGSCICEDGVMYVHGVEGSGGGTVLNTFVSTDLKHYEKHKALEFPEDISLFNTSVCKGKDGYVMAIEINGTNPAVGKGFTCIFATSKNLIDWELMDIERFSYSRERYTACPCLRYVDGFYYIINLEGAPCHRWIPYIVRTADFENYELGVTNPIMWPDDSDKIPVDPKHFTDEQIAEMENAVDCNNSDIDICDYKGKTVILYSWGNQLGTEYLACAEYDGTTEEFLKSFF